MKGDYLHYKLLTLPTARWLPNPRPRTLGWRGPLAGRGKDRRREEPELRMTTASWVPGCTWDAGEAIGTLRGLSPAICG